MAIILGPSSKPMFGQMGGDVTLSAGDSGSSSKDTASPAAKEAARQKIAWKAGAQFIADLKGLAGGSAEFAVPDKDADEAIFDSQLREALAAEGFNYDEELSKLKRGTDVPEWATKAEFFLIKMVRNVPDALKERVKEAFDGKDKDDFNTTACLSWAASYFGDYATDDGIVNMATILLDFAFVRQGIDDEYVAQVQSPEPKALPPAEDEKLVHPESETPEGGFAGKPDPLDPGRLTTGVSELQNLWNAAPDIGALFESNREGLTPHGATVVGRVKPTSASKGASVRGTGTFIHLVRSRSAAWRPKIAERINIASPVSIYRVAMVNAGLATGDHHAKEALAGSRRFQAQQPNLFVTLGVAAMALEPTDPLAETPYKLHTKFCRTCAGALPNWNGNGCCQMETFQGGGIEAPKPKEPSFDDIMGYLGDGRKRPKPMDGVKISHPRGEPWRVNVLPVWGPERWQNVGSRDEAVELGNRVLREHRASGNLTDAAPRPRPKPAPVPALPERGASMGVIVQTAAEIASVDSLVTDLAESASQYSLGRNLKWVGMATCAGMLFWTGSPMWLAFAGVAYVAGWALIDKKGIEAKKQKLLASAKEQKALPPG